MSAKTDYRLNRKSANRALITRARKETLWKPIKVRMEERPTNDFDAVWQYIIDHAQKTPKGIRAVIYAKNKSDLKFRVRGRLQGIYRNDEQEMAKEVNDYLADMGQWHIWKIISGRVGYIASIIDQRGNLKERIILWLYRKTRDYLQDETTYTAKKEDAIKAKQEANRP